MGVEQGGKMRKRNRMEGREGNKRKKKEKKGNKGKEGREQFRETVKICYLANDLLPHPHQ